MAAWPRYPFLYAAVALPDVNRKAGRYKVLGTGGGTCAGALDPGFRVVSEIFFGHFVSFFEKKPVILQCYGLKKRNTHYKIMSFYLSL